MAFYDTTWYCNAGDQSTTGYYAVAKRPQNTAVVAGQLVRQFTAPAVGSERVFVCIVAGTTANTTDATWVLTRGAKTTDGTATWQECTGMAAVNGDITNTPTWSAAHAVSTLPTLGAIIQRNNGASYWICSTAGGMGVSEPAWANNTAGTTQVDSSVTWTCLGVVGNFTGGQAPHARLANALAVTWFTSGNTVYVGDNHAETQAATMSMSPASALMAKILCHNHAGSYPPGSSDITTGATVTQTGAAIVFSGQGSFYFYGITFQAGTGGATIGAGVVGQTQNWYYFDNCSWGITGSFIELGASAGAWGVVVFNNTTVKFSAVGQTISPFFTQFVWQNTGPILASGSLVPTNLFNMSIGTGRCFNATLEALDLSQLTGSLFSNASSSCIGSLVVRDCKLNAAMTVTAPINSGMVVDLIRSDSAGTAYKSARYQYEGTETTETSITRVGGAVDPTGQAQSRKIVTTANAQWLRPFKAEPYAIWNPTAGANVTVTVCGTINAGAVPNNDDLFMEVEYLSDSGSPLGKIVTTTKANLWSSNAAVASDGSTWTVPAFTAWNPNDLQNLTLSNNGLTATATSNTSGVRAVEGKTSGKFYFEYTMSTWVNIGSYIGLALATAVNNGLNIHGTVLVQRSAGTISVDSVGSGKSLGTRATGDIIGIAVDLGAQLIWFRVAPSGNWNGDAAANPATGANGVSISALGAGALFPTFIPSQSAEVATANFGDSAFSGAVPSGFTSGWPAVWTPFKLTTTLSSPQPQLPGYITARIRAAKPSTIFYIDPVAVLS